MNLLITMRESKNQYGAVSDSLEHEYAEYFERYFGATVLPVSNAVATAKIDLSNIDTIVLTGGGSVPQRFLKQKRADYEQKKRDAVEEYLFDTACAKDIPIIGICRGIQFINGITGGYVSELDFDHTPGKEHIVITPEGDTYIVNSYHNDGISIDDLSDDLRAIAYDESKRIVEACRHKSKRILGLQWHPERKLTSKSAFDYTVKLIRSVL